jgi:hypothetical protein
MFTELSGIWCKPLQKGVFSEKLSFFSDSEQSEESEIFDNQRFRFFASFRMTNAPTNR